MSDQDTSSRRQGGRSAVRAGGRAARRALRAAAPAEEDKAVHPGQLGGHFQPLTDVDVGRVHQAVLDTLENIGLAQAIPSCIELVTDAGGSLDEARTAALPARARRGHRGGGKTRLSAARSTCAA